MLSSLQEDQSEAHTT